MLCTIGQYRVLKARKQSGRRILALDSTVRLSFSLPLSLQKMTRTYSNMKRFTNTMHVTIQMSRKET